MLCILIRHTSAQALMAEFMTHLKTLPVKCPDDDDISQVTHIKFLNGQAKLKESHKYYWQVQGELAVTGLSWCDFITNTKTDVTIERIWRDDRFIDLMKDKLDLFSFNTYMDVYLASKSC